jgi:lipopolysaccharide biosynthesis regulator YciM
MASEFGHFILLGAAVFVGWLMGYWYWLRTVSKSADSSAPYYKGLNYLLSEQADAAVLTVVNELPVNVDTLPTHLALGNLLRSKGEVDGAIRIHQNLLSRPSLSREKLYQVHLELARDYISAGVFDRAERLLRDVADECQPYRAEALEHLQHIYQSEREWGQAIAVAQKRLTRKSWLKKSAPLSPSEKSVERALSHYCCEQALLELDDHNIKGASKSLQSALHHDKDNVRAYLLSANLAMSQQRPQLALELLHSLIDRQPAFVSEVLPQIREAFVEFGGADAYLDALKRIANSVESSAVAIEIADVLTRSGDAEAGLQYLLDFGANGPTLKLVFAVLERGQSDGDKGLDLTRKFIRELRAERPQYRCRQCGFSGRKLHWLCPSCEQWGTITPIRGIQGD